MGGGSHLNSNGKVWGKGKTTKKGKKKKYKGGIGSDKEKKCFKGTDGRKESKPEKGHVSRSNPMWVGGMVVESDGGAQKRRGIQHMGGGEGPIHARHGIGKKGA